MNKNLYKVVFNKAKGMLVVVSENAKSQGKSDNCSVGGSEGSGSNNVMGFVGGVRRPYLALSMLPVSVLLSLGSAQLSFAQGKITSDNTADQYQQATIVKTTNELPQINIQTPSNGGVSRNVFSEFDITKKGAVINNTRSGAYTQMAGWVAKNPWLEKGEATIILNEVNSPNASQIGGFIEIAGQKAELIIANPSGISCSGCGFINANRTVLTTGKPIFNNNMITAFDVDKGKVVIEKGGMNVSGSDYTQIISRTAKINADIVGKNTLTTILGRNVVENSKEAKLKKIKPSNGETGVALDVGALGGMYFGKIHLIGTEKGMGVTNAGKIYAQSGELKLDIDGNLSNAGTFSANNLILDVDKIENSGQFLHTGTGKFNVEVKTLKNDNRGVIGKDISSSDFKIDKATNDSGKGQIIVPSYLLTESQVNKLNAESNREQTKSEVTKENTETASDTKNKTGTTEKQDNKNITSENIKATKVENKAGSITTNELINIGSKAVVYAPSGIDISADSVSNNSGSTLIANGLQITEGGELNNNGGKLIADKVDFRLSQFSNKQGSVHSNSTVRLQVGSGINNTEGQIIGLEDIQLSTGGIFSNEKGTVASRGDTQINAYSVNNSGGQVSSSGFLRINSYGQLTNNDGKMVSGDELSLNASQVKNKSGLIRSGAELRLQTNQLENTGQIYGGKNTTVKAHTVNNEGLIASGEGLLIEADKVKQNEKGTLGAGVDFNGGLKAGKSNMLVQATTEFVSKGTHIATGKVEFKSPLVDITGSVTQAGDFYLTAEKDISTKDTTIIATDNLMIKTKGNIDNTTGSLEGGHVQLTAKHLDNTKGKISHTSKKEFLLDIPDGIDNTEGYIASKSDGFKLITDELTNKQGLVRQYGNGKMTLSVESLNNNKGKVVSEGKLDMKVKTNINNQEGMILANEYIVETKELNNKKGQVGAQAQSNNETKTDSQLTVTGTINNLDGKIGSRTGDLVITSDNIDNKGELNSSHKLTIKARKLTNAKQISAGKQILIEADTVDQTDKGLMASGLDASGNLSVKNAQLTVKTTGKQTYAGNNVSTGTVEMMGDSIYFDKGVTRGQQANIKAKNSINNKATVAAEELVLDAKTINNQQGQLVANQTLDIKTQVLNNQKGKIQHIGKQSLALNIKAINNQEGMMVSNADKFSLAANNINNEKGNITHTGKGELSVKVRGRYAGASGHLNTNHQLTLLDGNFDLTKTKTNVETLKVDAKNLDVSHGQILMSGEKSNSTIKLSNALNNESGLLASNNQTLNINSSSINNTKGNIQFAGTNDANSRFTLTSNGIINNSTGKIVANRDMHLVTNGIIQNSNGSIIANDTLSLQGTGELVNQGKDSLLYSKKAMTVNIGRLDNAGNIKTEDTATLTTKELLKNTGAIDSDKKLLVNVGDLDNQGGMYGEQAVNITADKQFKNNKSIASKHHVTVKTGSFVQDKNAHIIAGLDRDNKINQLDTQLTISARDDLVNKGMFLAKSGLTVSAGEMRMQGANNKANSIKLTAKTGNLSLTNTQTVADNDIGFYAKKTLGNDKGIISAKHLTFDVGGFTNKQGKVIHKGASDFELKTRGFVDNTGGYIGSEANKFVLTSEKTITNDGGKLIHTGDISKVKGQTLSNNKGLLTTNKDLSLTVTGQMDNVDGRVTSAKGNITLNAGKLVNSGDKATIRANKHVSVGGSELVNTNKASVIADDTLSIASKINNNAGGLLASSNQLTINNRNKGGVNNANIVSFNSGITIKDSGEINNQNKGIVSAKNDVSIDTQALSNQGKILSKENVEVTTKKLNNNNQGVISAVKNTSIQTEELNNNNGHISANQLTVNLTEATKSSNSSGQLTATETVTINSDKGATLINQGGRIVSKQVSIALGDKGTVDNSGGLIQAKDTVTLNTGNVYNKNTLKKQAAGIQAGKGLNLTSNNFDNSAGNLAVKGTLNINAKQTLNNSSGAITSNNINLKAQTLNNNYGSLKTSHNMNMTTSNVFNDYGYINAPILRLRYNGDVSFSHTSKYDTNALEILVKGNFVNNTNLTAKEVFVMADNITNNKKGVIYAPISTVLKAGLPRDRDNSAGTLTNYGQIISDNLVVLEANTINNLGGGIIHGNNEVRIYSNYLNNTPQGGLAPRISSDKEVDIIAAKVLTNGANEKRANTYNADFKGQATITSGGKLLIYGDQINNIGATISASGKAIFRGAVNNSNANFTTKRATINKYHSIYRGSGGSWLDPSKSVYASYDDHPYLKDVKKYKNEDGDITREKRKPSNLYFLHYPGGSTTSFENKQYDEQINLDVVKTSDPGLISAGSLYSRSLKNNDSIVIVGGILIDDDNAGSVGVTNKATKGYKKVEHKNIRQHTYSVNQRHSSYSRAEFDWHETKKITNYFGNQVKKEIKDNKLNVLNADIGHTGGVSTGNGSGGNTNPKDIKEVSVSLDDFNDAQVDAEKYKAMNNVTTEQLATANKFLSKVAAGQELTENEKKQLVTTLTAISKVDDSGKFAKIIAKFNAKSVDKVNKKGLTLTTEDINNLKQGVKKIDLTKIKEKNEQAQKKLKETGEKLKKIYLKHRDSLTPAQQANLSEVLQKYKNGEPISVAKVNLLQSHLNKSVRKLSQPQIRTLNNRTNLNSFAGYKLSDGNGQYLFVSKLSHGSYGDYISSEYMYQGDMNRTHMRLGDGYYEAEDVSYQYQTLSGRHFTGGQMSKQQRYKQLMDNGMSTGNKLNLTPGVALTAEQMRKLDKDIVWLVAEDVTMPDGTVKKVLKPKVYVRALKSDVNGTGAIIAANNGSVKLKGDLNNTASFVAHGHLDISANNVNNTNNGLIRANTLKVKTEKDINNFSSTLQADSAMKLKVKGDLNLVSELEKSKTTKGDKHELNQISHKSRIMVGDKLLDENSTSGELQTTLHISVDGKSDLKAADVINQGGMTYIKSKGDVNLGAQKEYRYDEEIHNDKNYSKVSDKRDVGSNIAGVGTVVIEADNITGTGANISSSAGNTLLLAKGDVTLKEGRHEVTNEGASSKKKSTWFNFKHTKKYHNYEADKSISGSVTGNNVLIKSDKNIKLTGMDVVGDSSVTLDAKKDVSILAAQNKENIQQEKKERKAGIFLDDGVFLGIKKSKTDNTSEKVTHTASRVGANNGNLNIISGGHYQQTGSLTFAGKGKDTGDGKKDANRGNVNIIAKSQQITGVKNTEDVDFKHKYEQAGISATVSSPLFDGIKGIKKSLKTLGKADKKRTKRMAGVNTILQIANYGRGLGYFGGTADDFKKLVKVRVEHTVGYQKSEQEKQSHTEQYQGSTVQGSSSIYLKASNKDQKGKDKNSNIEIVGSNLTATDVTLVADNKVIIGAEALNNEELSKNKSFSAAIGAYAEVDAEDEEVGFGVTANVGESHGNKEAHATQYAQSHISANKGTFTVNSGGNTEIKGGIVTAERAKGRIGGDLIIESLQDTQTYTSEQENNSIGVDVNVVELSNSSVTPSRGQTKVTAEHKSVTEQSGIFTGDGGFDIQVAGKSKLTGGAVTTTEKAISEGKNIFISKGGIETKNLENFSKYESEGYQASVSISGGSLPSPNVAVGGDEKSVHSVTHAGISGHAGKTDISTDKQIDSANPIENVFNAEKVEKELNMEIDTMRSLTASAMKLKSSFSSEIDGLKKEKEKALKANNTAKANALDKKIQRVSRNKTVVDVITGGATATTGWGVVLKGASPIIANEIGKAKADDKISTGGQLLAHGVLAYATSEANGNNGVTGGVAAVAAEGGAKYVADGLFGKKADELNSGEKATVSNAGKTIGTVIGLITGDAKEVENAGSRAQVAVDNNFNTIYKGSTTGKEGEKQSCFTDRPINGQCNNITSKSPAENPRKQQEYKNTHAYSDEQLLRDLRDNPNNQALINAAIKRNLYDEFKNILEYENTKKEADRSKALHDLGKPDNNKEETSINPETVDSLPELGGKTPGQKGLENAHKKGNTFAQIAFNTTTALSPHVAAQETITGNNQQGDAIPTGDRAKNAALAIYGGVATVTTMTLLKIATKGNEAKKTGGKFFYQKGSVGGSNVGNTKFKDLGNGKVEGPKNGKYTNLNASNIETKNAVIRSDTSGVTYTFDKDGKMKKIDSPNPSNSSILDKKAHHDFCVGQTCDNLRQQGYTVGKPISFKGSCGSERCVPDIPVKDKNGDLFFIEVKTGKAKESKNQTTIFPQIQNGEAYPTGQNAKAFGLRTDKTLKEQGYPNGIRIKEVRFEGVE